MRRFREQLIRRNFEAVRDLTWAQLLEPKFRQQGVDEEAMQELRDAWNLHAEKRDWAWWQNHARHQSNAQLQDELEECIEQLDAIGLMRWRDQQRSGGKEAFRQVLHEEADGPEEPQAPSWARVRGIER